MIVVAGAMGEMGEEVVVDVDVDVEPEPEPEPEALFVTAAGVALDVEVDNDGGGPLRPPSPSFQLVGGVNIGPSPITKPAHRTLYTLLLGTSALSRMENFK